MTPKERVLAAINHQKPDRIPTDLGTTNCTSIAKVTYDKLKDKLKISTKGEKFLFTPFQIMQCDEEILKYLQIDTRALPGDYDAYEQKEWIAERTYKDRFGVVYKMPENGLYFDFYEAPLEKIRQR
ncbi:MAG: hypothetical protein ACM3XR_10930 [Bacillota bacterium]